MAKTTTDDKAAPEKASPRKPYRTTMTELRDLVTVPLVSDNEPNAAGALNYSFWAAYDAAKTGRIPTLPGTRKKIVSVPVLLRMLGAE